MRLAAWLACLTAITAVSADSRWQGPYGPHYDGTAPDTALRQLLPPEGPPRLWSYPTGDGYASPAILGERLFFTHQVGDETFVDCLNAATGKRLWRYAQAVAYRDQYSRQYGPRSSPVIAGDAIIVHAVNGKLFCLAIADGTLRWQRDLAADFAVPDSFFGVGSTPLVIDKRLFVNVGGPKATLAAFDLATGKTLWTTNGDWGAGYAAVVPATLAGQSAVLAFCGGKTRPPSGGLLAVAAKDGRQLARHPWRSTNFASVNAATPIVKGDRLFITAGYATGACQLHLTGEKLTTAWQSDALGCQWSTPILKDGHLYGIDGSNSQLAELVCLDWRDGSVKWRQQPEWRETTPDGPRTMRIMRGSLLAVDGNVLCLGEAGHLLWLDLTPTHCRIISRCRLFSADQTFTPPAIAAGRLYVCQNATAEFTNTPPHLHCYDLRTPQ